MLAFAGTGVEVSAHSNAGIGRVAMIEHSYLAPASAR